jgi:hypothetical protein
MVGRRTSAREKPVYPTLLFVGRDYAARGELLRQVETPLVLVETVDDALAHLAEEPGEYLIAYGGDIAARRCRVPFPAIVIACAVTPDVRRGAAGMGVGHVVELDLPDGWPWLFCALSGIPGLAGDAPLVAV